MLVALAVSLQRERERPKHQARPTSLHPALAVDMYLPGHTNCVGHVPAEARTQLQAGLAGPTADKQIMI